jgi:microcystin-dependent protein
MAQPYIGEIRIFAGNFAPAGWAFCDGQLIPISENDALFTLIGTTYGGDGQETFALPNLQSRIPIHQGKGTDGVTYMLAEAAGTETVTLTTQQIPSHNHAMLANQNTGTSANPQGNVLDQMSGAILVYKDQAPGVAMSPRAIGPIGGSQPHNNFQPYLCLNFIISLFGIFPSQT